FQVSSFTGAATYAVPLWVPAGPGGLQPQLSLNYNSQTVDSAGIKVQASWVGMGWNLSNGGGYIQHNMNGSMGIDNETDDTYTLVVAGVSSPLLPLPDSDGNPDTTDYATTDLNFWRIRHYKNDTTNAWVVWDKQGNKYTFGSTEESRARYSIVNTQGKCYPRNWRWHLTKIENKFEETLKFTYWRDTQEQRHCDGQDADIAIYPMSIVYPNNMYRIVFDWGSGDPPSTPPNTPNREDYQWEWDTEDVSVFYERFLLEQIWVEHNIAVDPVNDFAPERIRTHVFTYYDDETEFAQLIYPNLPWTRIRDDSQLGKTPTLKQYQEFGGDLNAPSLPPNTFSYTYDGYDENMHLTVAENGYGGKVEFEYDAEPWYELDAPKSSGKNHSTRTVCESGDDDGDPVGWKETESTTELGCSKDDDWFLKFGGEIYRDDLYWRIFQPGAVYKLAIAVKVEDGTSANIQLGLWDFSSGTQYGDVITIPGDEQTRTFTAYLPTTGQAKKLRVYLNCFGTCLMDSFRLVRMPTHYRVTSKTVSDATTGESSTYTYTYDGGATNDPDHSVAVHDAIENQGSFEEPVLQTPPYLQFRGHSTVRAVGPGANPNEQLVSTTWFYQDDYQTGRAHRTVVGTQDFYESFNTQTDISELDPDWWLWDGDQALERVAGDQALKNTGTLSVQGNLGRKAYTVSDGEVATLQFMIAEGTREARFFLDTGDWEGKGDPYWRWGILIKNGQAYISDVYGEAADIPLDDLTFTYDTWYLLFLGVDDDDGFYIRVWERDDFTNRDWYHYTMPAGKDWRFLQQTLDGTAWFDEYSEGEIFNNTVTQHAYNENVSDWEPDQDALPFREEPDCCNDV
ncbi:MAG: hypothetical protein GY792_24890, partial [Gammaproteobacteria bacterium]|nr:hypothetical protein [Gammaproteobacteria bacterium]